MAKKIMTAQQAFNVAMNTYPALYNAQSLEMAQIKFYNHIFNTIGNGYRNNDEFLHAHTINKNNKHLVDSFPDKYITDKPLYYAYTEKDEETAYKKGLSTSRIEGIYTEEELKDMPEVKRKLQCNTKRFEDKVYTPYPNFKKEYSIVWEDITVLDKTWIEAALKFYAYCSDFFNTDKVYAYHYACPKDDEDPQWKRAIADYEQHFPKYKKENQTQEEYHQEISKAYEMEYTGNTKEFIKNKWQQELSRIKEFLIETNDKLESILEKKNEEENKDKKVKKLKM